MYYVWSYFEPREDQYFTQRTIRLMIGVFVWVLPVVLPTLEAASKELIALPLAEIRSWKSLVALPLESRAGAKNELICTDMTLNSETGQRPFR